MTDVRQMRDAYVACRTVGHSWDDNPTAEIKTIFSWVIPLRCTRCGTERFDYLNNAGDVLSRMYRYPDGYRRTRNDEKISRMGLRVELMRRRIFARRVKR